MATLREHAEINIGHGCGFSGSFIGCARSVRLGDHVQCGVETTIWDTDWHPRDPRSSSDAPVVIGNNVWLGAHVMVMKGVTIGENTVVGAGSLVARSLPPGVVAMGVPARVVKQIDKDSLENIEMSITARSM